MLTTKEESGNLLLGEVWLPHLLRRSGGYIHLGALLFLDSLQPVTVHLLLALLAQAGDLQAMLMVTKMVFAADSDDGAFDGRTYELNYLAAALADKVLVVSWITDYLVVTMVVAVLDLAQNAQLNKRGDQPVYCCPRCLFLCLVKSCNQIIRAKMTRYCQYPADDCPPLRGHTQFRMLQQIHDFGL